MSLFRLDASIMPATSASREIADIVEEHWVAEHPGDDVVRRHVGSEPLPADAWANAVTAVSRCSRRESSSRWIAITPSLRITGMSWPCEVMTASTPQRASQVTPQ